MARKRRFYRPGLKPYVWSNATGRLWWKHWTGTSEALVWELTFLDDGEGYLYDDGMQVEFDEAFETSVVSGLDSSVFVFVGETYAVRWLSGDELVSPMTTMNVERVWDPKPDRL